MRVTGSRELVAEGHSPSVVARMAQISRQAIYRTEDPAGGDKALGPARWTAAAPASFGSPGPTALAPGHEQHVGGRARLVLPDGRHRLLHREKVGWHLECAAAPRRASR